MWAVARKELRQVTRDPISLIMLLGLPAFMLVLYGYALNFDVRHVSLAVQDRDHSTHSRDLISSFVNSTYFDVVATRGPTWIFSPSGCRPRPSWSSPKGLPPASPQAGQPPSSSCSTGRTPPQPPRSWAMPAA
jgi:hypothetical protein